MKLKVPKRFGKKVYEFEVEGSNLFECLMEGEKLSFPSVLKCGICQGDKLRLRAYETEKEKYEYIKVECFDCRSSVTFGKKKNDPDTYFLRKTEDGKLDWQEGKFDKPQQAQQAQVSRKPVEPDLAAEVDELAKEEPEDIEIPF